MIDNISAKRWTGLLISKLKYNLIKRQGIENGRGEKDFAN